MSTLCILTCHNFQPEVQACIRSEGWPDVQSAGFASRCGRPPVECEELRAAIAPDCSQVVILGRACLAKLGTAPAGFPPVRIEVQEQCFHLIAGKALVEQALEEGSYLMTPAWLRDWRRHVQELGFPPEQASEFFQGFAKKLAFLDTGIDTQATAHLADIAATLNLPVQRIAVGCDHTTLLISRIVQQWRLDTLKSETQAKELHHARELADHAMALDLLGRMTKSRDEAEVITATEDLFRMLFAPTSWHYIAAQANQQGSDAHIPDDVARQVQGLTAPYGWTDSGQGFLLRVARNAEVLGHIVVDGLAFAQHRQRYLNLALTMADMMALALENARTRKRLVQAEKMASLGVMVAGVAHEINTPVGVGVLAASTLRERTQTLSQSFAQRRMTQSDLQGYLKDSLAQSSLILSNLDRVGLLIDKFRQVAVNGLARSKSAFRPHACIQQVIESLGDRLDPQRVTVELVCDETLELESYPADWVSIFTNFMANSLQHGFKDRTRGTIHVEVTHEDRSLNVVYRDDGQGLTSTARDRIFDPFFTTDMQNGIGLGMHLVYNLITQRLGGRVSVESGTNQGVCFRIDVPDDHETKVLT